MLHNFWLQILNKIAVTVIIPCLLSITSYLGIPIHFDGVAGSSTIGSPTNLMPNVLPGMLQPDYWITRTPDADSTIMTVAEIQAFNNSIRASLPDKIHDLKAYPNTISGEELRTMLDHPFPNGPLYTGANPVDANFYNDLSNNVNLVGIYSSNQVQYAFTTKRTIMRTYPNAKQVSNGANDVEYDLFQETALHPFEPILLLHLSRDGAWYYVQMYNYRGWVPANDIAIVPDYNAWLTYQQNSKFLVVTGNHVILGQNPYSASLSGLDLPMGTILPIANPEDVPDLVDGQSPTGNYAVQVPVRGAGGTAVFRIALVPCSSDVNEGFLQYNRVNVIRQAFKMEGDRYGWGGMLNGRDCSALILDIYRCFGFALPRNADEQEAAAGQNHIFKSGLFQDRTKILSSMKPGDCLYLPGHTMMYLGSMEGHYYVISALGSWGRVEPDGSIKTVRVHGVVVNSLDLTSHGGKTWLDLLTTAKSWVPASS